MFGGEVFANTTYNQSVSLLCYLDFCFSTINFSAVSYMKIVEIFLGLKHVAAAWSKIIQLQAINTNEALDTFTWETYEAD